MHSFNSCLMHCVFSTKERRPWLTPAIRERLWPYLGGIARQNDMKALAIGVRGGSCASAFEFAGNALCFQSNDSY